MGIRGSNWTPFTADMFTVEVPTRCGYVKVGINIPNASGAVGLMVGDEYVSLNLKDLSRAVKDAKRIVREAAA